MNVLFVASDNNYTSGAFLSMVKLNEILNREYCIRTFVVLPNEGDGEKLLKNIDIPYEIVPSRNWIVDIEEGKTEAREREKEVELQGNENAINRICDIIMEKEIDLLHINTSYSYVGAKAALKMNIPFVWHIREFLEEDQNRKIWNREKGYHLMSQATAIVAISNSIYKKYETIFPKDKLCVIYNGIDEKKFYNPQKEILQGDVIQLGIVGGVVPHKGQEELLKACGELKKKGIDNFYLSIVGKGKDAYKEHLENIAKNNGIEEQVAFLGASDDIPAVLRKIDILFVCSRNEAFGRVTVEGMMAGCLIIGADTAGTVELLEDGNTGYLYKHGNYVDLAKTIEKALKDKNRMNDVRRRGQKTAYNLYTAHRNAQEIVDLYNVISKYNSDYGE